MAGWGHPISPVKHTVAWLLQGQRQRLGEGTLLDQHQQKEAARRKAREEKARQARRAAIQVRGWPEPCGKPGAEGGPPVPRPLVLLGAPLPPSPRPWARGLGQCDWGQDEGLPSPLALAAHRGSPRQELQQKRAQKSGNADLGLLKATGETEKPQPTQEPAVRPGSTAQQTRKANNTGEQG